jgi:hypothetical protein
MPMRWLPLLALLLCAPLARATTLRALDESALLAQSRVAAVARVVDVSSKQTGKHIVTVVHLVVSQALKGAKNGDELSVLVPGGAVGDWVQHVEGAPAPRKGETCLVFLEAGPGGLLQFTGLALGYGRIRAEASTPKLTAPRKIKLCAQCDLVVCSSEERIAEAKRYRTSDNSEA